jgi:hypothetical protein
MVASRDGVVSIDLNSLDDREVQVFFSSNQYSDGPSPNWRIDVSDNTVLLPPHGVRSLVIKFGFRQCFAGPHRCRAPAG